MAERRPGFWDLEHRLGELSARGDPLEKLSATVNFEMFRGDLVAALGPRDPAKVEADARFDGLYVLRTDTTLKPLQVVLRYRNLLAAPWRTDSRPPRPCSPPGRSSTRPTPPSVAMCSARSSLSSCARN
jgi:hypothetical protein